MSAAANFSCSTTLHQLFTLSAIAPGFAAMETATLQSFPLPPAALFSSLRSTVGPDSEAGSLTERLLSGEEEVSSAAPLDKPPAAQVGWVQATPACRLCSKHHLNHSP